MLFIIIIILSLLEFSPDSADQADPPDPPEMGGRLRLQTPLPHAPGVRMTVVYKLPQMIIVVIPQTCEAYGVLTYFLCISRVGGAPKVVLPPNVDCVSRVAVRVAVTKNCKKHSNYLKGSSYQKLQEAQ